MAKNKTNIQEGLMADICELERKMLTCDHKCAEHESTQESIHEIKKCITFLKDKIEKVALKTSWIVGILFLAGLLAGYGLNSIHDLELNARKQAGKNQTFQTDSVHVSNLTVSQKNTEILLAKIQNDITYIKQDMIDIKKIINRDKP